MKPLMNAILASSAMLVAGSMASAVPVTTYNDTLNTPFFPGSGNPNTGFAITRLTEGNGNEIEIGLKSKQRYVGDANVTVDEHRYFVQPGYSQTSAGDLTPDPTRAWWSFDFSVDLGMRTLADTEVIMTIDFDGDSEGPLVINFGSDGSLGSLLQDSWNTGFSFLSDLFHPFTPGTYDFSLVVRDRGAPFPLAGVTMQTIVIPLPTTAGMALAGMGLLGVRRRR